MPDEKLSDDSSHVEARPMTARALINALAQFPDDTMVLVTGYEGDLTLAQAPEIASVARSTHWDGEVPDYYGDWERSDETGAIQAVYIGGERHNA